MFVSVNGKAKEVKEIFAGGSDGLAHKINEVFGSVNGVAKLIFSSAPKNHNAFDDFTWAEIKTLADEGRLLEYFNRFDKVDIKLTEPLVGYRSETDTTWYQDTIPMVISEISATGMRLVAHIATPYRYVFHINNATYTDSIKNSTSTSENTTVSVDTWGMCNELYNGIKSVDNALPNDMRDVLTDFAPIIDYGFYTDEEGKTRLRTTYDDCRVRQCTSCGYSYHQAYIEDRGRNEYVLDTTYFPRTKSGYLKYIPQEVSDLFDYGKCYGVIAIRYEGSSRAWRYTCIWNDPDVSYDWDWENYNGVNHLDLIKTPSYKTYKPDVSNVVPEVQIGTL